MYTFSRFQRLQVKANSSQQIYFVLMWVEIDLWSIISIIISGGIYMNTREFDSCLHFFTNQIAQNVDYINAFEFFCCQICEI